MGFPQFSESRKCKTYLLNHDNTLSVEIHLTCILQLTWLVERRVEKKLQTGSGCILGLYRSQKNFMTEMNLKHKKSNISRGLITSSFVLLKTREEARILVAFY